VTALPGHPVTDEELVSLGFTAHDIVVRPVSVDLPGGRGCEWTTLGDVPDAPGLYAFTIDDGTHQHVAYVGLTTHLWMVTKGRLPRSGGARPGQRYGRPKYAGVTRQRVNILIAAELEAGRLVRHWLRPTSAADLRREEEALIQRWRLRQLGWNRG
jgi:hypothetical protein